MNTGFKLLCCFFFTVQEDNEFDGGMGLESFDPSHDSSDDHDSNEGYDDDNTMIGMPCLIQMQNVCTTLLLYSWKFLFSVCFAEISGNRNSFYD